MSVASSLSKSSKCFPSQGLKTKPGLLTKAQAQQGVVPEPPQRSGLQRFQACRVSEQAAACAQEICELADDLGPEVQDAVQIGLERLAWMIDRRVRGLDAPGDIEHELDTLKQGLSQPSASCDRLAHWDELMQSYVYNKLRYQSESAGNASGDVYAQQWNRTFADLFVGPGDRCVPTVLPILKQLLELKKWDWLPKAHRGDRVERLEQLLSDPSLLSHIDELAQTNPVNERALHFLKLSCEPYHNLNYMLLKEVLNAFFTPRLQDRGMLNCWRVAVDRGLQAEEPHLVLEHMREFLESGTLAYKKNRDGEIVHVVPDPYPEQAAKWAVQAYDKWKGATDGFVSAEPKLTKALQRALPGVRTDDAWKAKMKDKFIQLQKEAPGGRVRIRDVLEHLLADHLKVPPFVLGNARVLIGDGLSEQPNDKWQAWKKGLEDHADLLRDALFAIETAESSSLAHVWQSSYSKVVIVQRLARQWLQIEKVLREGSSKPKPLPGMEAHLKRMRKQFFEGATLHPDFTDEDSGEVKFRLFVKVPGAPGRGMAIRNSTDLITWLDHYSTLAGQADGNLQPRQCLARVKAVLCSNRFRAKLEGKGKAAKPLWLADVSMGYEDHRGDLLALPDLDGKRHQGKLNPVFFGFYVRNELFVREHIYRVDAPIGVANRWGRPRSPEKCLIGLVHQVRSFGKKHQPEDFRQRTAEAKSLVYDAHFSDLENSHVATLRKEDPGFRALWASGSSAEKAIDSQLKRPMKAQLKAELDRQTARKWVDEVLHQCWLLPGADRQAAVDEVLQRAQRHGKRAEADPLSLKSLVWALQDYRSDRSSVFADRKAARKELVIAVLNQWPGGAPMAVTGHNNYRSPEQCYEAYVADPFNWKRIVHVDGQYLPVGKNLNSFRAAGLIPSRIF